MKTIKKLFFVVLVIAALTSILTINASAASSSCWLENNLVSGDNYYTRSKQTLSVYIRTDYQSETVHLIIKNSSGTVMYNASKDIFKQTYVYHCAFNVDMSKYSYGKYYVYSYVGSSKIDERVFYIGDWKQDSNGWWFKTGNTYLKDTSCYINNEGRYIFNSKGYLTAGWYYNDRTNGWWYFTADGKQVTSGWKSIDGKWYYFNSNNSGNMATGWLQISGKWYYFGNDGAMKTGWQKVNNKWYYFNKDGDMKTGWYKENGKWYYLDASNGDMKTGWAQCGTSYWYYFNADGVLQSGWKKINGGWYYLDPNNDCRMASGLVTISGKRYYLDPNNDSKMYTGVKVIDGYVYLFKSGSGDAASGWYKEGDKWYYFNPSTNRLITGFATINSKTYYFDWYMYTGLHKIEGNLYYFDPADDSAMAKNKQIVVEGVTYNAAANGVLTPVNATITDSDVSIVDSEYCTCEPTITVTVGGVELTRGTDYTIAYEPIGNSTIGTATITGIGNYSGTVEKTWTVIHSYYQGECEGCEAVEP